MEPSNPQKCLPEREYNWNIKKTEGRRSPCSNINRTLLPYKAFHFLYHGANGTILPILALYYRHLWLLATQAGLLVGLRPILQSTIVPFWALCADKFNAKKIVFLIGLCGWFLTHTCLLLIPAGKKPLSCNENLTYVRKQSEDFSNISTNNINNEKFNQNASADYNHASNTKFSMKQVIANKQEIFSRQLFELLKINSFLKNSSSGNPLNALFSIEINNKKPRTSDIENSNVDSKSNNDEKDLRWATGSSYASPETWRTFTYLCLILFVGDVFAAPTKTFANTATLQALGSETHKYGEQHCFGAIGWGVIALVAGMLVSMNHDRSLACKGLDDINYTPCFYAFAGMMLCAIVVAIKHFKFRNVNDENSCETDFSPLRTVYQQLNCLTLLFFSASLLAGFNLGFIETFLFWHLQTLGGSQQLFSIVTCYNAMAETIGFLLSVRLISKYGHLKVLALGFFAYAVRMAVYGIVENPWCVLTVEFLKAFTSSGIWASVMSYIGDISPTGATLPGMQMLCWGVGEGGGGILGGVLMEVVGARITFIGLAVISFTLGNFILAIICFNCCPKKQNVYKPVGSDWSEDERDEQDS